jgi:hypothetical protein
MKKLLIVIIAAALLSACNSNQNQLQKRAEELCKYIPDHELLEQSKGYMTDDFYAVLDTMFNHLPEFEAMDHEWLYYFVTGNGGTIADCTVTWAEQIDDSHAIATVSVRQKWEDGSFDEASDIEEHKLYMEKVNGHWLMSDFDKHKQDCIRHIAISRREQAMRDAISDYLVNEIGKDYLKGELCIPTLMIVAEEDQDAEKTLVWGDFWVFWYNIVGDTLKTVSGGNHSGCMALCRQNGTFKVTGFEQTVDGAGNEASAKQIFGEHFDVYCKIHSNDDMRETARKEQLQDFVKRNGLNVNYYQDYGWPAVTLFK